MVHDTLSPKADTLTVCGKVAKNLFPGCRHTYACNHDKGFLPLQHKLSDGHTAHEVVHVNSSAEKPCQHLASRQAVQHCGAMTTPLVVILSRQTSFRLSALFKGYLCVCYNVFKGHFSDKLQVKRPGCGWNSAT